MATKNNLLNNVNINNINQINNIIDNNNINDNTETITNTINTSININSKNNNNLFLNELIKCQLKNIPTDKRLSYSDIKRISKFITKSIFDENECSIWDGYITNEKNKSKGIYINFYFNKKKIALHRLLYINYIENISTNEYIKYICNNKGKCCNVNHMKKFLYNKNNDEEVIEENETIKINTNKEKLIVEL